MATIETQKEIDEKYKGRFYSKTLWSDIFEKRITVRVDKIELTKEYKDVIYDVELKVARRLLKREPTDADLKIVFGELQVPAYVNGYLWEIYFMHKSAHLKQYGIEWLSLKDLNIRFRYISWKDMMLERENLAIEKKYIDRFFYKEVDGSFGGTAVIRVDKVELTPEYKAIIHDVELEVASKFMHRQATENDINSWYEDMQLPGYAGVCDIYWKYYAIKQKVLKKRGIEWLSFLDLNLEYAHSDLLKEKSKHIEPSVEEKIADKFYFKFVDSELFGITVLVRIDKIEATEQYRLIAKEVERKVACRYLRREPTDEELNNFYEELQLPEYASDGGWKAYYQYKKNILKEYGIDWLSYPELNPERGSLSWNTIRSEKSNRLIEEKYAGRFYYKTVESDLIGTIVTVRIDKTELTEAYMSVINEVELKVAREFLHREPSEEDMRGFYEDLQLPMYAGVCDKWKGYYAIKYCILRDEYGIEWLGYDELNDGSERRS